MIVAFRDGVRRVQAAPAVVIGVMLLTYLVALPFGGTLHVTIADSLGSSLAAEAQARGANPDWWEEFSETATGVGATFTPQTIGIAGVLSNVSDLADAVPPHPVLAVGIVVYLALWTFLVGGILDRFARNRPTRQAAFFSTCGVFFFRFIRLGVVAGAVYLLLFALVHGWLFDGLYRFVTRDWIVERHAFALRVALYVVFGAALAAVNLVFDYAKVRAVVEDRRSMIGAVLSAFRFVRRHPGSAIGLYGWNSLLVAAAIGLYALVAPGASLTGWALWLGLAVTQAYLLLRVWIKLVCYASEVSMFQARLAHADYTAAALPVWPDSPAVEGLAETNRS